MTDIYIERKERKRWSMLACRCIYDIYAIAHVYIFKEITPKEMVKKNGRRMCLYLRVCTRNKQNVSMKLIFAEYR